MPLVIISLFLLVRWAREHWKKERATTSPSLHPSIRPSTHPSIHPSFPLVDTYNWTHNQFYSSCLSASPLWVVWSPVSVPKAECPDTRLLPGSALLFIITAQALFDGYYTNLWMDTIHGQPNERMSAQGKSKDKPDSRQLLSHALWLTHSYVLFWDELFPVWWHNITWIKVVPCLKNKKHFGVNYLWP